MSGIIMNKIWINYGIHYKEKRIIVINEFE